MSEVKMFWANKSDIDNQTQFTVVAKGSLLHLLQPLEVELVLKSDYDELTRQNTVLREALESSNASLRKLCNFTTHYEDCDAPMKEDPDDGEACDCGLDTTEHNAHIRIKLNDEVLKSCGKSGEVGE